MKHAASSLMVGAPANYAALLETAGCDPWSKADIKAYKKAELLRLKQPRIWRMLYNIHPILADETVATMLMLAAGFGTLVTFNADSFSGLAIVLSLCLLTAAVLLLGVLGSAWHWHRVDAVSYARNYGHIPYDARALMARVEMFIPDAKFHVDYIGLDPILYVSARKRWYGPGIYRQPIYVWGPKGERIAPPVH